MLVALFGHARPHTEISDVSRHRNFFPLSSRCPCPSPSLPLAQRDSTAFAGLRWREIGPYRGGRSVAVTGNPSRENEFWMGTTGGGVFKSINAGQSWAPVTDKYFGGTIGAIEVAPSAPDVVYVGGGEYPIRGNVSHGDGVWKTTDGGKTWTFIGLGDTRQIADIVVHPTNPDLVYVGVLGHLWAPHPSRGVFRSKDGGKTWEKILFKNDSTGVVDLVMDPNNPNVLYAALWQAGRTPWMLVVGRHRRRSLEDDRWRRSLDRDHAKSRAAGRHLGQHRHRGVRRQLESSLGEHRSRFGRRVPLERRRPDVDADEYRSQSPPARVVLHEDLRRSERHQRRLRQQCVVS